MSLININNYILNPLIFTGVLFGLIIWISFYIKNTRSRNYGVAPMLFLLHSLVFFLMASLNIISRDIYIIWRNLIFIHALIVLITTGIVLSKATGGKK
jgi:hypothetical protein